MPEVTRTVAHARAVLAVAALGCGALLAGCTDTPTAEATATATAPRPASTPSPTPTPSAAPETSVAPARPAALDGPGTPENAKAVAVYFDRLYPYVYATGDLNEWTSLTHPDCIFCHGVITEVSSIGQVGQRMRGGAVNPSEPTVLEIDPGRFFEVNFHVDVAASDILDSTGAVIRTNPASSGTIDMIVIWENGAWVVREATPTQDGPA